MIMDFTDGEIVPPWKQNIMKEWGFVFADPEDKPPISVDSNLHFICRQCGFLPKDRVILLGDKKTICNKCGMVLRSDV